MRASRDAVLTPSWSLDEAAHRTPAARAAVLVPCYNEASTVAQMVESSRAALPGAVVSRGGVPVVRLGIFAGIILDGATEATQEFKPPVALSMAGPCAE